jgi:hypothetical protein
MTYPEDLFCYSGTARSKDGPVSIRFLLSTTEYSYLLEQELIPADTALVIEIKQLHDLHLPANVIQ